VIHLEFKHRKSKEPTSPPKRGFRATKMCVCCARLIETLMRVLSISIPPRAFHSRPLLRSILSIFRSLAGESSHIECKRKKVNKRNIKVANTYRVSPQSTLGRGDRVSARGNRSKVEQLNSWKPILFLIGGRDCSYDQSTRPSSTLNICGVVVLPCLRCYLSLWQSARVWGQPNSYCFDLIVFLSRI
jgi:hypothetical protein